MRLVFPRLLEAAFRTSGLRSPDVPGELIDPSKIKADPKRFQFKETTSEEGTTSVLDKVKKWDPIKADRVVVWQDKGGTFYIVDGHHRLALAKRLQSESGVPKQIEAFVLREADGIDARQARALGAMRNLAAGRGTPLDAARFMRDTNTTADDLEREGVSLREGVVSTAIHLAALVPSVWNQVATGKLTEAEGAAIGAGLPGDDMRQRSAAKAIEGKRLSQGELRETVSLIAAAPEHTEGKSLFGEVTRLLFAERGRVLNAAKRILRTDRRTFATLNRRLERIEVAGNKLDPNANRSEEQSARESLFILEQLATRTGAVSRALTEAAQLVATRKGAASAVKEGARSVLAAVAALSDTELTNAARRNRRAMAKKKAKKPTKKAARSKAAKKAARTRAKNKRAKQESAQRAAKTRAKNKRSKKAAAKKGAAKRTKKAAAKKKAQRALVSAKVSKEVRAGRPQPQAVAIAMKTARAAGFDVRALPTKPNTDSKAILALKDRAMKALTMHDVRSQLSKRWEKRWQAVRSAIIAAQENENDKSLAKVRKALDQLEAFEPTKRKNPAGLKTAPGLSADAQLVLFDAKNRPGKAQFYLRSLTDWKGDRFSTVVAELVRKGLARRAHDGAKVTAAGEVWPNVLKPKARRSTPTQAQGLLFGDEQPERQRQLFELNPSDRPKAFKAASKDQLRLADEFGVVPTRAERITFWNAHGSGHVCAGEIVNITYIANRHGRAAKWSHDLVSPMYAATTTKGRDELAKLDNRFTKATSVAHKQGSLAAKWVQLGPVFSVRIRPPKSDRAVTITFPATRRPILMVDDENRRLVMTYKGEPTSAVPLFGHVVSSDARAISSRGVLV